MVFGLYVVVVRLWNASRASYSFVITPIVTVLLSVWLDEEPVGIAFVFGGILVLAGVYVGALRPLLRTGTTAAPEAQDVEA